MEETIGANEGSAFPLGLLGGCGLLLFLFGAAFDFSDRSFGSQGGHEYEDAGLEAGFGECDGRHEGE